MMYVDKAKFYEEIKAYHERRKTNPLEKIPVYCQKTIIAICGITANSPSFRGYPFKDDIIAEGVEICIRYFNNFDPEKSQEPFSFFTQTATRQFFKYIAKEKRQFNIKKEAIQKFDVHEHFLCESEEIATEVENTLNIILKDYVN